jgi:2',3'-cyclic-nucleotide 2'-phosphodiesterase (5'-nucleotidase family)
MFRPRVLSLLLRVVLPLVGFLLIPYPAVPQNGTAPDAVPGDVRLGIFVQTDSRGELRPCKCPGQESSGLSLRRSVFGRARAMRHPVVILDAGDFTPSPDDSLRSDLSALMVKAMGLMPYDAVALGELELLLGLDRLREAARALPLVCSNLRVDPGLDLDIPAVRWVRAEGRRVAVVAYLDPLLFYSWPDAFEIYGESLIVLDPVESLPAILEQVRSDADVVVLLAHASRSEIDRLLGEVPGLDVVVQGHEPGKVDPGSEHDGTWIVVPGPRSRQVAQLTLSISDQGVARQGARMWDLKLMRAGDRRLDALVKAFEARHGSP